MMPTEMHTVKKNRRPALRAEKAVFDLCFNGTSCSASQAPSCVHFLSLFVRHLAPTPSDFRTYHLRYARALLFRPQHWLLCHLDLY
jgi:hypothetical protein